VDNAQTPDEVEKTVKPPETKPATSTRGAAAARGSQSKSTPAKSASSATSKSAAKKPADAKPASATRAASKTAPRAAPKAAPKAADGTKAGTKPAGTRSTAPKPSASKSTSPRSVARKPTAPKAAGAKSAGGRPTTSKPTAPRALTSTPTARERASADSVLPESSAASTTVGLSLATSVLISPAVPVSETPIAPAVDPVDPVDPVDSADSAETSDAQTHTPVSKPDAVLAGLARLRALAAQFGTQAPGIEVATPPADAGDAPATPDAPATDDASVAAPATPAAVKPKTKTKTEPKTPPQPQPNTTTNTDPDPEPKPEPEPKPTQIPKRDAVVAVRSTISHELEAATGEYVLEVRGLSKGFGDTVAVNDIQLNVRAGVFYGIVGPNGAGKTTTLSMITGLLRPDSGTASVNGVDVWDSPEIAKRSIGVLPDRLRIFDRLTGSQLLYYSGVLRGLSAVEVRKRSADLASAFGLDDVMGRLVSDYSSGMLKKVALAAAMIHSPRLLVLDEPFESVDPVSAATVTRILKQYVDAGGTVLLSSHRMELVQRVCSHVAVIVEGTLLADGTIDQVRNGMSLEDRFVQLTGKNSSGGGLEWLSSFSD